MAAQAQMDFEDLFRRHGVYKTYEGYEQALKRQAVETSGGVTADELKNAYDAYKAYVPKQGGRRRKSRHTRRVKKTRRHRR